MRFTGFMLLVPLGYCLQAAQLPVPLGSAANFAVLAGSTVTNTGPSAIINGNVGVSPGSAITGFPPGTVTGGTLHAADLVASLAQSDLTAAYNNAAGRLTPGPLANSIGGITLLPGLYSTPAALNITGNITLDGQGNSSSVFIIQVGASVTTASGVQILLIGNAQAANVFWQVGSSATFGTGTAFKGTVLALTSITLTTGATLTGRALARNGAVTLDTNSISSPGPAVLPPTLSVTCPSSTAQIGVPYNSSLVAAGGTPPYTYSITLGPLPGLTLNPATGALTGTPTGGTGVIFFNANVADSATISTVAECSLTTTPALPPPTPAPPSLILVITGFAGTALYQSRERIRQLLGRS